MACWIGGVERGVVERRHRHRACTTCSGDHRRRRPWWSWWRRPWCRSSSPVAGRRRASLGGGRARRRRHRRPPPPQRREHEQRARATAARAAVRRGARGRRAPGEGGWVPGTGDHPTPARPAIRGGRSGPSPGPSSARAAVAGRPSTGRASDHPRGGSGGGVLGAPGGLVTVSRAQAPRGPAPDAWTAMPKPLVIVESPAKARTIAGFLGGDYVVESSDRPHPRPAPQRAGDPGRLQGRVVGRASASTSTTTSSRSTSSRRRRRSRSASSRRC